MSAKTIFTILIIFSVLYSGCAGNDNKITSVIKEENYKYSFYDSSDILFIDGKMKLITNNEKLSGEFTIDSSYSVRPKGFLAAPGILSGNIDSQKMSLFINMSPKIADNNIFIYADMRQDSIKGYWVHSTMTGISGKGNFVAVKILNK